MTLIEAINSGKRFTRGGKYCWLYVHNKDSIRGETGLSINLEKEDYLATDWEVEKSKKKVKRKIWVNVYPINSWCSNSLSFGAHSNKQLADNAAGRNRLACVETEIEYEVEE